MFGKRTSQIWSDCPQPEIRPRGSKNNHPDWRSSTAGMRVKRMSCSEDLINKKSSTYSGHPTGVASTRTPWLWTGNCASPLQTMASGLTRLAAAINSATPEGQSLRESRFASSPNASEWGHGAPTLEQESHAPPRPWQGCTPRIRHQGTQTISASSVRCCPKLKRRGISGSP